MIRGLRSIPHLSARAKHSQRSSDNTIVESKHAVQQDVDEEAPQERTRTCFPSLPLELLNLIFDNLEGNNKLSLSLCNHYFWSIGITHIQNYHMSSLANWAREKIVCVGSNINAGDYPPGMFTDAEVSEFSHKKEENGQDFTLDSFARSEVVGGSQCPQATLSWQLLESKEYSHMSNAMKIQARNLVVPEIEQFYPSDQPWVLRNFTTKELVYAKKIALKPEYVHGPFIDVLGLCEVLMSRICWSTWTPGEEQWLESVHRGVWAGHRFDITMIERHERVSRREEWKDVTEQVMKEIAVIWEIAWGAEWRQIVCDRFDTDRPK